MLSIFALTFTAGAEAFNLWGSKGSTSLEEDIPVEVLADQLEFLKDESKIIGKGNVVVTYKDLKMTGDYAEVYTDTKKAFAQGHVVLRRGEDLLKGDKGYYDFMNDQGSFPKGLFVDKPFYGSGEEIEQVSQNKIVVQDAVITTCSHKEDVDKVAHYDIKASKVIIYPDDKLIARNVVFRMLEKPVFWLPFLHVPLKDRSSPFHIQPGHSSEDGFYVLGSKRYGITKGLRGKVHVDYRSKRGWGFGNDLDYNSNLLGNGLVKMYIADDQNSPDQKYNITNTDNPYDNRHNDTRYRLTVKHRKDIGDLVILGEFNKLSDKFLLKDFFEREYREEVDPETYATATYNKNNFGIFVNLEKRVNHFVSSIEKLPEVRFNWNNQELFNTNIYYKNEDSLVSFNRKREHSSVDDDVVRLDTFHEISYPMKIWDVCIKPSLNWRGDYYSKKSSGKEDITRSVIGGSVDMNTKFYRIFDVNTNFLNLNITQLRHILEPTITYDYVRYRSELPEGFFKFDAIDSIDDLDLFKFGFENRLQTKRRIGNKEKTVNVVSYNTYLTYEYKSEEQTGSSFLTWDNEIEFRPYSWLNVKFDLVYDVPNDEFRNADLDFEMRKKGKWHLYLQNKFLKEGSKLLTLDGMYKINSRWGVGGYMRVEFDEENITEEWEVRASRDLHCWLLDFGYNERKSEINSSNREIFVELTLKAFPQYPLKSGNRSSYSRARMGDTVAGANIGTSNDEFDYSLIRY